jgi:hypothetical protein
MKPKADRLEGRDKEINEKWRFQYSYLIMDKITTL